MTNIDLKRLAVDRDYWDECGAPEDATHVGNRWGKNSERGFMPCWYRLGDGAYFYYPEDQQWEPCKDEPCHAPVIPRPPKRAQEVEWDGSAFPIPAGAKCEVQMGSFWYPGTVIASTTEAAWFKADQNGEFWTIMNGLSIRPLLTKQQRQREELALCLQNDIEAITGNKFCDEDAELLADNLLFKGWSKEPKP